MSRLYVKSNTVVSDIDSNDHSDNPSAKMQPQVVLQEEYPDIYYLFRRIISTNDATQNGMCYFLKNEILVGANQRFDQVKIFSRLSATLAQDCGVEKKFTCSKVLRDIIKIKENQGMHVFLKLIAFLFASVYGFKMLSSQYEIVVNCPGVEARQLVGDQSVESVRGQIIRVRAPWLKTFLMVTNKTPDYLHAYIFPGAKEVVLGGIEQVGDWDLQHRDVDREYLWKTCTTLLPCLQNAEMVKDWTGLRPVRTSVRLEVEYLPLGDRSMTVVHCYGHGGSGVTLHWGCAKEVAELVKKELNLGRQKLCKL